MPLDLRYALLAFLAGLPVAASAGASLRLDDHAAASSVVPATVYQTDGRMNVASAEASMRALAGAGAAMVHFSNIRLYRRGEARTNDGKSGTKFDAKQDLGQFDSIVLWDNFEGNRNMCAGERFEGEGTVAFATAFLVSDDLILTAGHSSGPEELAKGAAVVFGFDTTLPVVKGWIKENGYVVRPSQVYRIKDVVARVYSHQDYIDWALVRLDRPVQGVKPLALDPGEPPAVGTQVFTFGHPKGLPMKVTDGGKVTLSYPAYGVFDTDLSVFHGNSGGPVLDRRTGLVVGLVVSAATAELEFEDAGGCKRVHRLTPAEAAENPQHDVAIQWVLRDPRAKALTDALAAPAPETSDAQKQRLQRIKDGLARPGSTSL